MPTQKSSAQRLRAIPYHEPFHPHGRLDTRQDWPLRYENGEICVLHDYIERLLPDAELIFTDLCDVAFGNRLTDFVGIVKRGKRFYQLYFRVDTPEADGRSHWYQGIARIVKLANVPDVVSFLKKPDPRWLVVGASWIFGSREGRGRYENWGDSFTIAVTGDELQLLNGVANLRIEPI